jgi:uncharacterized membrane protein YjjP (DUF1212 family)
MTGFAIMSGAAYHKHITTDQAGIEDRSFRLAHNYNQTKWDYFSLAGMGTSGLLFSRLFGGFFRGSAVGMALGSLGFFAHAQFLSSSEKPNLAKMKGV